VTDQEKGQNSPDKSTRPSKGSKDGWDKAEITFKFLGTIVAAVLIATFGILGNNYLQEKQRSDSDIKLYTQLLSSKETAENTLRKDMFGHILQSFLKQKDAKIAGEHATLSRIREMRLSLELISRNFHESLDMKPLFKHLLMEIIRPMVSIRKCFSALKSDRLNKGIEAAEYACGQAEKMTNEKIEIDFTALKDNASRETIKNAQKKVLRLLKDYESELDLLVRTAKRVTRKQREVLEEVAGEIKLEIPLKEQPQNKICTTYSPVDWLPEEDGTCKLDNDDVRVEGVTAERTLTFKTADGQEDKDSSRYFRMKVRYVYPRWKQIYVEILTCPKKEHCEENEKDDQEKDTANFWLGYFDFPLVDHTYLSEDQRYSVILEGFKEGQDGKDEKAKIVLLYYPASYAGLKEKSFYNNQLMRGLLKSELFRNKEDPNERSWFFSR